MLINKIFQGVKEPSNVLFATYRILGRRMSTLTQFLVQIRGLASTTCQMQERKIFNDVNSQYLHGIGHINTKIFRIRIVCLIGEAN